MKIAIIGASSFVGKNLILLLIKKLKKLLLIINQKNLLNQNLLNEKLDISLNKINHYKFLGKRCNQFSL